MKAILPFSLLTSLLLVGCGDGGGKSDSSTNESSSVITAPVDYLGAVGQAQQKAVKTVDTAALNQAVQLFQVQEGRLPKDLNELVEQKYIGAIPQAPQGKKIVYDATTGTVKIVAQ